MPTQLYIQPFVRVVFQNLNDVPSDPSPLATQGEDPSQGPGDVWHPRKSDDPTNVDRVGSLTFPYLPLPSLTFWVPQVPSQTGRVLQTLCCDPSLAAPSLHVPPKGLATSPLQQRPLRGWNEERRAFQGPDPGTRGFEGLNGSAVWESMKELSPSSRSGKGKPPYLFMQVFIRLYIPLKRRLEFFSGVRWNNFLYHF